jgi:multidrug efflux pump subunit AcrA (membrane-fusion protein)
MDTQFVLVSKEENNKMVSRKQNVTVGMTYNGLAEIKSGLKAGDKVISAGYLDLNDGQLISIQQ